MIMKKYLWLLFLSFMPFIMLSCTDSSRKAPDIEGMIFIPAGEFIMGSNDIDTEGLGREFGIRTNQLFEEERPERRVTIGGYYIDKYEVTNSQYKAFVNSVNYRIAPEHWTGGVYPEGEGNHPVSFVTWYDAFNYCKWAGKRLPSEEEWEKAIRGPDGNMFPWGNEYDGSKANFDTGETKPVGSYETDKSYYGVYDMGGNVSEWVQDWFKPYPGNTADIKDYGEKNKVIRGGAGSVLGHYIMEQFFSRGAKRGFYIPNGSGADGGFRCGKSVMGEAKGPGGK